jgi:cytochrome c-type biogenesis protein CcmH
MNAPTLGFLALAALLLGVSVAWVVAAIGRPVTDGPAAEAGWAAGERRGMQVIGAGMVVLAVGGYAWLGNWHALDWADPAGSLAHGPATGEQGKASDADVAAMVDRLASQLAARPAGPETTPLWVMLGRAQAGLLRFEEAAQSFGQAAPFASGAALAEILADQADALLAARQANPGFLAPLQPASLVGRALQADPQNLKVLALAGTLAFDAQRYPEAARHWAQAVRLARDGAAGPELLASLQSSLDEAQARLGGGTPAALAQPAEAAPKVPLRGAVSLASHLAARAGVNDTVFVVVRAAGPGAPAGQPLAVLRFPAGELPRRFVLGDEHALDPRRPLSTAGEVLVSARVSRSGDALPHSGDFASAVQRVMPGLGPVTLEITAVVP